MSNDMAEAWFDKFLKAQRELDYAEQAPALFKPEHVESLKKARDKAAEWTQFWRKQP